MKALVKPRAERGLELHTVQIPSIEPGCVLVKIAAAGICGSDRHIYEWDAGRNALSNNVPFICGHEGAGIVQEVSETVSGIAAGDRVAFESHIHDSCSYVRRGLENICPHKMILGIGSDGVFAEYALVPAHIIRVIPNTIPLEVAAVFEPATIGLRALDILQSLTAQKPVGQKTTIAVFGATGIMGAVAALAARWYGFDVIAFGRDSEKLSLIKSLDRDITICDMADPDLDSKLQDRTIEGVIETTGAEQSLALGRKLLVAAGSWIQIGIFGHESDTYRMLINDVVRREITFKGVVGRTKREWNKMIDLCSSGALRLEPLITNRYALDDFESAFKAKEGIKSIFAIE